MHWYALMMASGVALISAASWRRVLARLPEPDNDPTKRPYASLGTPALVGTVALAAFASSWLAFASVAPSRWALWLALTSITALAVVIDLRTTYLPRVLAHGSWGLAALGAVIAALVESSWAPVIGAALGAAVVGGAFHLFWLATRAIGYGDVRLLVTIGAITAPEGAYFAAMSVFLGTLIGAVWGIAHRLRVGQSEPFPYGPALWLGPFVALGARALGWL